MSDTIIKICVLGAPKSGKTCLCKTLAEQSLGGDSNAAIRVQEFSRQVGQDYFNVQLWDVAAAQQSQAFWEVLSKNVDGVLLVIDPAHPEQERELEQLYLNFAQPNNLTMKQCMVVALTINNIKQPNTIEWEGLKGKLRKLSMGQVSINCTSPESGRQAASSLLDKLLSGCAARKKERIEQAVLGA